MVVPVSKIVSAAAPTLFVAEFGELLTSTRRTTTFRDVLDTVDSAIAPQFVASGAMDRKKDVSSCPLAESVEKLAKKKNVVGKRTKRFAAIRTIPSRTWQ